MKFTTLDLVIDGPFARLWMNRPRTRNPIDDVFIRELQEAFNFAEAMPDARAVVLGGRGKAFCSGADMNWMKKAAGVSLEQNIRDAAGLPRMLETIANSPLPVVARIHGDTWAGGVGIAAACDVAIASRGAEFCLNEVRIGLIPATICPYVIRAMGYRAAQRYALTGERFPAAEALRIGLVHEVVAEHELDDRIDAVLKNIAAAAPMATRECKRLMRDVTGQPIDAALANDMVWRSANMRVSPDGKEGLDAFFEKRDPVWLTNVS